MVETGKTKSIGSKMVKVDKKPQGDYTLIGNDFYVIQQWLHEQALDIEHKFYTHLNYCNHSGLRNKTFFRI